MNGMMDKYNKNKNQGLIMLDIKFEGYNNQYLYNWGIIYCVYSFLDSSIN